MSTLRWSDFIRTESIHYRGKKWGVGWGRVSHGYSGTSGREDRTADCCTERQTWRERLNKLVERLNKLVIVGHVDWLLTANRVNCACTKGGRCVKLIILLLLFLHPPLCLSTDGLFSCGPTLICLTSPALAHSCRRAKQRKPIVYKHVLTNEQGWWSEKKKSV